jgi:hypothetical protein
MNRERIKEEITQLVMGLIPDCHLTFSGGSFGGTNSLCISFATSKVWSNNIIHNDPGHTQLWIHNAFDRETGEQINPLTLDSSLCGYHNYKTDTKSKCGFRKINKPSEWPAVKKVLTVYFTEMKKCIDLDAGK